MENENTNINVDETIDNEGADNKDTKTYTPEEVQEMLQKEADRRVSQALAKQKKDYEKKLSLATLDEAQRTQAEKDIRIQELQEQLQAFQIEKNKSELKSVLSSRGLSAEFADLISITDNIEESQSRIDTLDKLFKQAVKSEVEKRLASNSPKENFSTNKTYKKENAKEISIEEMMALKKNNPEQYKALFC